LKAPITPRRGSGKLVIKSCLAAERLDIEEGTVDSLCLKRSEKLKLPQSLEYSKGAQIYTGFKYMARNRFFYTSINNTVTYGPRAWQIGLIIFWTRPQTIKRDLRECLVQMSEFIICF
jgi:hypothetical protein